MSEAKILDFLDMSYDLIDGNLYENKQEKKTCNDKGEWGNFIYNGNSLKDILFGIL